ncbi:hypothetical protein [Humibacter albus]|uniref:hypothetical protein n=1 Tax=Humibacter albus TaxID=427754 RepID=UPI0012F91B96|nr:hypothetical protein [Humibacter albus]
MGLSGLFAYSAANDEDIPTVLALAWAEAVLNQADALDTAEKQHNANLSMLERMDYDYPPDEGASFRCLWVTNHTFVWMVMQLAIWVEKAIADDAVAPPFSANLRNWRNALEHLNEALIMDSEAIPDPTRGSRQSISEIGSIRFGSVGGAHLASFATTDQVREWVRLLL